MLVSPARFRLFLAIAIALASGCAGLHSAIPDGAPNGAGAFATEGAAGGPASFASLYSFRGGASDGAYPFGSVVAVKSANGETAIYGTTHKGGTHGLGTIFKLIRSGTGIRESIVHSFAGGASDGSYPRAGLIESGGVLYGTTNFGGSAGQGTVFAFDPAGNAERVIHSFGASSEDGAQPVAPLLAYRRGAGPPLFYGTTYRGGKLGKGTVFSIDRDGSERVLHSFGEGGDGAYPHAGLTVYGGALIGTTYAGGRSAGLPGEGSVFRVGFDGQEQVWWGFTLARQQYGQHPISGVVINAFGTLYGTAQQGGPGCALAGCGTVYALTCRTNENHCGSSYPAAVGTHPKGGLILKGSVAYGTMADGGPFGKGAVFKFLQGSYLRVHTFNGSDGAHPVATLYDAGNELYGTTVDGGAENLGTVFEIAVGEPTPSPSPTTSPTPTPNPPAVVYRFEREGDRGNGPHAPLTYVNGLFYGTARVNGDGGCCGEIFSLTRSGTYARIYRFRGVDGSSPQGGLLWYGGRLWGTVVSGGSHGCAPHGCGAVFSVDPKIPNAIALYPFNGVVAANPYGSLALYHGKLYGTTAAGGSPACAGGCGIVYGLDPHTGAMTVVHTFKPADGTNPHDGLIVANDVLYGTALRGGSCARAGGCGTVFQVTPLQQGRFRVVHEFKGPPFDGDLPYADLLFFRGRLWGTTLEGGEHVGPGLIRRGTIFAVDPASGTETFLYSFAGMKDGERPYGGLVAIGGTLYGTTYRGGQGCVVFLGCGTVFSLDPASKTERVLYAFRGSLKDDGAFPHAGLIDVDGTLYGTTASGGVLISPYHTTPCCGTAFDLVLHPVPSRATADATADADSTADAVADAVTNGHTVTDSDGVANADSHAGRVLRLRQVAPSAGLLPARRDQRHEHCRCFRQWIRREARGLGDAWRSRPARRQRQQSDPACRRLRYASRHGTPSAVHAGDAGEGDQLRGVAHAGGLPGQRSRDRRRQAQVVHALYRLV